MKRNNPEALGFSAQRTTRIDSLMSRYVDSGKLAGLVTCIAYRGQIVHTNSYGFQNLEDKTPMSLDSIFRIYSMTKPVTAVSLMILFEEALFNLTDPVSQYIPAFKDVRVYAVNGELEVPIRPITVQDLLRHTAGLSYGEYSVSKSAVDKLYDEADLFNPKLTSAEFTRRVAELPLMYHPGEKWHYSVATDIAGYLVEILSGMPLADFMQERIFDPLGMVDTGFEIEPSKIDRFCSLYGRTAESDFVVIEEPSFSEYLPPVSFPAGGSGLVSTTADYLRFAQCILNKGQLENTRLLGPKTVTLMTCNHLPTNLLPISYEGSEPMLGMGYGLGFGIMLDPAQAGMMGSVGDHSWGGNAETYFWIDPDEELIAILMSQYQPSQTYPIRKEFRSVVYQALTN